MITKITTPFWECHHIVPFDQTIHHLEIHSRSHCPVMGAESLILSLLLCTCKLFAIRILMTIKIWLCLLTLLCSIQKQVVTLQSFAMLYLKALLILLYQMTSKFVLFLISKRHQFLLYSRLNHVPSSVYFHDQQLFFVGVLNSNHFQ